MKVIPFDTEHYEDCWLMGLEFLHTTKYGDNSPSKLDVYETFEQCRNSKISFVAIDEYGNPIGMILAVKTGVWFSKQVFVSQEVMWWVDQDYRKSSAALKLLSQYEKACADENILYTRMNLLSTSPENLSNLLIRRGYEQMEISFVKENK